MGRFKQVLLGRWLWRFYVERGSLWTRVIESRHGMVWGRAWGALDQAERVRFVDGGILR